MYTFQSLKDRNADLGDKVKFSDYYFQTNNEEVAGFVRRNCQKNPHLYIETTPEVLLAKPKEEQLEVEKKVELSKRGRKKVEVVAGMRTNQLE